MKEAQTLEDLAKIGIYPAGMCRPSVVFHLEQETKMPVKPLDDRVVIERLKAEESSPGGIVLPERSREKPSEGLVVAVGPGKLLDNGTRADMTVKVGDTVIFTQWAGEQHEDGKDIVYLRESDILAVKVK